MPQNVTHQFHQNHVLTLLSTPPYQEGSSKCGACGKKGDGFSYHCSTCKIDLYPNCASIPMILTHQSHHHQLNLTFSVPYQSKMFRCNVCKNIQGCEQWLYRCNLCGFDAHLDCAIPKVEQARYSGQVPCQQQFPLQASQPQHHQTSLTPAFPIDQTMGNLLTTTVTSVIAGAAQSFGQMLGRSIFGDGDAGGGGDGGGGGGVDGGSGGF